MEKLTPGKAADVISVSWGFAEATLFFFVPDIWITLMALSGFRKGLRSCLLALAGALVGGCLTYLLGISYEKEILTIFDYLPSISVETMNWVSQEMKEQGVWAVFVGPGSGTPYKIYAATAASANMSLAAFLAVSVPARLLRFLGACLAARCLALVLKKVELKRQIRVMMVFWVVIYVIYFSVKPN